jgi:cytochrome c biogenesis protein CcdA/thiol-disulfide isomerase/thioredoxin
MLYLVAFTGGVLTIVSPCILPVLPFVFARAGQSFRRSGVPMLLGMALTFALVSSLAAVAGEWIVRANQLGRTLALIAFAVFGVTLLLPSLADRLARPFVKFGGAVQRQGEARATTGGSILLGMAAGLLWTPCAGPILGLILAAVAVAGTNASSALMLVAFAGGAACALAVALLIGGRALRWMKQSLGAEAWIRRGLGMAVIAGVISIALGWDTSILARVSLTTVGTATNLEQRLVDQVRSATHAPAMAPAMMMQGGAAAAETVNVMPSLDGAVQWFNSPPLTREGLRGKVVLIDFWTYSCINCLRAVPYVDAWARKYKDSGLVVIGVHTPEFAFERDAGRVEKASRDLKLSYPIAVDSNRKIWTAFNNQYWPAHYLIDRDGTIQYHHFGEGNYDETERIIRSLLDDESSSRTGAVSVAAQGVQAAPDLGAIQSPETYVGYDRQEHFASPQPVAKDRAAQYSAPGKLQLNQWGLVGTWRVGEENALLTEPSGKIVFRFHARDLHLVLGPRADGQPVRFRVTLDGAPPAAQHGVDVDAQGNGLVKEHRLFQLIRQKGTVEDRTLQIEFLDGGVEAFAFTFG